MANLTLSVGLVNVPVALEPLTRDTGVRGRMLCPEHMSPCKQGKMVCEQGKHEVERTEIVTGFELPDGSFTELDRDALKSERTQAVSLEETVEVEGIDPLYFEKTYFLKPREGGQSGYDLLAQVLREDGRGLVGTVVLSKTTRPLVIRWSEAAGCLVAHQCTFDAKIRWHELKLAAAGVKERPAPSKAHVAAARQLLTALEGEFSPETFVDDYQLRLREALDAAAEGREIEPVKETVAKPSRDLLADLQASLGQAKPKAKPKPKPKTAKRAPAKKRTRKAA